MGSTPTTKARKSLMLFYGSLGTTPHREVHVPPTYREVVERIYREGNLPRTVHGEFARRVETSAGPSRFRLDLRHETGAAVIFVESYGEDFLAGLDQHLRQLRLNRFELIVTILPMADPGTSHFGSGLREIGLSFAGIYPEYDDGDVLLLQSLNNVEVHPEEINVASELGEFLRDFVVDDARRAGEHTAQRQRSQADLARIFEALD